MKLCTESKNFTCVSEYGKWLVLTNTCTNKFDLTVASLDYSKWVIWLLEKF